MRQTKFRGWSVQEKKFVFGDLIRSENLIFIFPEQYGFFEITSKILLVDPETVGEYIGVADKDGIDIYEGDIVQWQGVLKGTEISTSPNLDWSNTRSCFYISYLICHIRFFKDLEAVLGGNGYSNNCIKVVGNIHETISN